MEIQKSEQNLFDQLRRTYNDGSEFWSARDLMVSFGYSKWENFQQAVTRAIESCENSGNPYQMHSPGTRKMVSIGSGNTRDILDFPMVRATLNRGSGAAAVDELSKNHAARQCAMLAYAQFAGVPGWYAGEFRWHKLQDAARRMGVGTGDTPAHSARDDALTTQRLLMKMREARSAVG